MGLRRPGVIKDYEEMPGANVPVPSKNLHHTSRISIHHHGDIGSHPMGHDLEMSSVSVVPDGNI